jgi:hypothetical protein
MKTVRVLGLRSCSRCNSLKGELDYYNIPFSFIDVDKQSRIADFVEDLLQTDFYPIALVEDSGSVCYVYSPDTALDLGKIHVDERTSKIGVFSLDDMVREIKTLLK